MHNTRRPAPRDAQPPSARVGGGGPSAGGGSSSSRSRGPLAAGFVAATRESGSSIGGISGSGSIGGTGSKALEAAFRSAQQSGVLVLQGRELQQVPPQAFSLQELSFAAPAAAAASSSADGGDKWWEREPLKKIDFCNNALRDIPHDISKARDTLRVVLLAHNEFTVFPAALLSLPLLSKLDLSHNKIRDLRVASSSGGQQQQQLQFGSVSSALLELSLAHNCLAGPLSPALGQLTQLDKLDLSNNEIASVPAELNRISCLKSLNLAHNQLASGALPDALFDSWQQLSELDLSVNRLDRCPPLAPLRSLARLDLRTNCLRQPPLTGGPLELKELYLGFNQLTRMAPAGLPSSSSSSSSAGGASPAAAFFGDLQRLTLFDVQNNSLTEVPLEIVQLRALNTLDLRNNDLSALPAELALMPALKKLYVEGNMLKTIPTALIEKGAKAIIEHLKKKLVPAEQRPPSERVQDWLESAADDPWKPLVHEARGPSASRPAGRRSACL